MTRAQYLAEQKSKHGRRVLGVFPAQYPKEILWALNIVPAEIWDPPLAITKADAHLQPYICSVVKLGLELIVTGKAEVVDGFLFPHTCDSIQNLASVVFDYLDVDRPCHFFYHPKAPYAAAAHRFYVDQLKALAESLAGQFGPLDPTELKLRVEQGEYLAELFGRLYRRRAAGRLDMTNTEFYELIRRGEWLFPDDFIPQLEAALELPEREPDSSPAIVVSGVTPNPVGLLTVLDELGVRLAHDDFLSCSRRLLARPGASPDPFERLAESYFSLPPCSTKASPIPERRDWLLELIEASGAKGVLFYLVKFCEPELFDVPNLTGELNSRGVATLSLDVQLNEGLTGRLATRIEAFIEMLG